MESIIIFRVVVTALQILNGFKAVQPLEISVCIPPDLRLAPVPIHSTGNRSCAIILMDRLHQGRKNFLAIVRVLHLVLFIAQRPHDDTGVIAVAQDHFIDMPHVLIRIAHSGLGAIIIAEPSVFIHHQHAQFIACIIKCRGH